KRGIDNIFRHECTLRKRLEQKLCQNPRLRLFSSRQVQSGVLSFQIQGLDCELAAQRLDDAGFAVRAGLHCAPLAHESVGTLHEGTVRVSFSALNTEAEVDLFAEAMKNF
ncbi:MAG: aminotransferase class V-fold PLP-dependent enzyme, partial [Oscillospiraceae bacterium]|nr:aminotransferase class V-fold PLP-dependent enzyme [Oscillospiraceae bacterium]